MTEFELLELCVVAGKENAPDNTSPTKVSVVTSPDQNEEKLKARAERFGGFQSDEAKKAARAARLGVDERGVVSDIILVTGSVLVMGRAGREETKSWEELQQ